VVPHRAGSGPGTGRACRMSKQRPAARSLRALLRTGAPAAWPSPCPASVSRTWSPSGRRCTTSSAPSPRPRTSHARLVAEARKRSQPTSEVHREREGEREMERGGSFATAANRCSCRGPARGAHAWRASPSPWGGWPRCPRWRAAWGTRRGRRATPPPTWDLESGFGIGIRDWTWD